MRAGVLHLSAGLGLDIAINEHVPLGTVPTAMIDLQGGAEAYPVDGCAMVVRLSAGRLRTMLGNGPMAESILARSVDGGGAHIPVRNSGVVRRIVEDIRRAPYDGAGLAVYLQGKVLELLVEGISEPDTDEGERLAMGVRDLLLADPLHPPSLTELARLSGVPPRKLSTYFRAHFGKTIFEWLVEWRLLRARDLVLGGDVAIKDIAYSLGYAHVPALTAAFTRRFGASPTRLRVNASSIPEPLP